MSRPKIGATLDAQELGPPCPFCGGKIAISHDPPSVLHSLTCEKFMAIEDPRAFLRAVRAELERKARN